MAMQERKRDSRQGKANGEANMKMVGPRVGDKNPSSRAEEDGKKVPRTKLFPREQGRPAPTSQ